MLRIRSLILVLVASFLFAGCAASVINTPTDPLPYKWKVVQDVAISAEFKIEDLGPEHLRSPASGRLFITGEEMLAFASQARADLGLSHGKLMLAKQSKLNSRFQECDRVLLPGAFLRVPTVDDIYIPYLHWDNGRWQIRFDGLSRGWSKEDCLAVVSYVTQ